MRRQWIQYERKKEWKFPHLFDDPRYVAGVIILALGAFCVFQAWYLLFYSSYFTLQEIEVKGTQNIEFSKIMELGELEKGQRTLGMNFGSIAEKIEGHPRIQKVSILQVSPQSIQITIQEREEWLEVWGQSSVFGLSREGFFFPLEKPALNPKIRIKLDEMEWKDSQLSREKLKLLSVWIGALEESRLSNYELLSLEDLSTLYITVQGIPVYLEDVERFREHEPKIAIFLKDVLQTGKTIEYIDARFEDMVVKMG